MDILARWANQEKSLYYFTFSGPWDWKDFYSTLERERLESGTLPTTPVLADVRGVTRVPPDAILHLKRAAQLMEEVNGPIVVIATSGATITTYNLFVRFYRAAGLRLRLVGSEEEAYALLQAYLPAPATRS